MAIRVVCFDLGGVLLQINHEWAGAVADAGVACRNELGRLIDFKDIDAYQSGAMGFPQYLAALAEYLGVDDVTTAEAVHMAILREEYPGVPELIGDLHAIGIGTGILSNTSGPHWEHMHRADLFPGFNRVRVRIASHEAGMNKPEPAIFEAFRRAAGVRGEEILFFDDYEANCEGARAAGWQAYRVDSSGDTVAQMRAHLLELGVF